ncbi:MAG: hypothetical protein GWP91_21885, partial [Rhodobacterales bacterium]|nr:hypothetical protein [Rhodobacterales bacterium]
MRQTLAITLVLALTACQNGGEKFSSIDLELKVDSPIYGSFTGDEPVVVSGHVTNAKAVVWVEGHEVVVSSDGSFRVE